MFFFLLTVEDILQNGVVSDLKDLKEALIEELKEFSESLESRIFWANCEFTHPFDISLANTEYVDKFIQEKCLLGNLTINTDSAPVTEDIPTASAFSGLCIATPVIQKSIDYSMYGSLIQTVDSSSSEVANFTPFSVAVSRSSGHFVALDKEMKQVHIFNEEGEPLKKFRILYGDLCDVGVSNENEIIVLNRESNRVLHYDMNGNFRKKFVTAPEENVKFTSLSVDIHGRFIISSCPCYEETQDDTMPHILVYNPLGKLTLSFGDERLLSPEKAVFLNGKFFVVDHGNECIMVFDKSGNFLEEIGQGRLNHPCSIAVDYTNGSLAVSDRGTSTIQIFTQDGRLLHSFGTEHIPLQVSFTKNYKNLLVCFEIDDGKKNIQMLTYS